MSPEKKKRGLSAFLSPEQEKKKNRGMGAFVGSEETLSAKKTEATNKPNLGIIQAEISSIKPSRFQARKNIPLESIKELSDSIKTQGVIQPLIVRKLAKGYELVAGERRLRASKLAGLNFVPVLIREDSEESALTVGLIENLQREDLNPLEEAEGILRLQKEFGLTQQSMGEALGKSRSAIANSLRLLQLSKPIQKMLFDGQLTMGHARALLPLPPAYQEQIGNKIISSGLSVRQAEKLASSYLNKKTGRARSSSKDPNIVALENSLSDALNSQVIISHKKNGSGKISLSYKDLDQLEQIIKPFKKE
ncbi:ParB/RepB/Spo0J family partition protein [Gammaproteobacteria bacterium]|nr:ParB/RepB/Spo0J family partition protein [Gammaproteobacteria bacterium]